MTAPHAVSRFESELAILAFQDAIDAFQLSEVAEGDRQEQLKAAGRKHYQRGLLHQQRAHESQEVATNG